MGQCFHQNGNCFQKLCTYATSPKRGFPNLCFDLVTNKIESKHMTQSCQAANSIRQYRQPVASAPLS